MKIKRYKNGSELISYLRSYRRTVKILSIMNKPDYQPSYLEYRYRYVICEIDYNGNISHELIKSNSKDEIRIWMDLRGIILSGKILVNEEIDEYILVLK